jgi:hypothetical protein
MFIKKHTQGEGGGRIHQPGTKHPLGRRDRENQHKKAAGKNVRKRRRVCWFRIEGACGVCMGKCPVAVCRPVSEVQGERNRGEAKRVGEGMRGGLGERGAGGRNAGCRRPREKASEGIPGQKNCRTVGDGAGGLRQGVRI